MKVITLVLTVVAAVAVSSCCCQSQPAPALHKMPRNMDPVDEPVMTEPVKVLPEKSGK